MKDQPRLTSSHTKVLTSAEPGAASRALKKRWKSISTDLSFKRWAREQSNAGDAQATQWLLNKSA